MPELDRTVMPDPRDVVVIGGGFAGLSAGVALAEAGFRVAVLERKPKLGGRAYSFQDPEGGDWVDNGQHVLMGCYTQTLDFLKKIGTYDQLVFRDRIEIEMIGSNGERGRLKAGWLPGPLHMASALMGYSDAEHGRAGVGTDSGGADDGAGPLWPQAAGEYHGRRDAQADWVSPIMPANAFGSRLRSPRSTRSRTKPPRRCWPRCGSGPFSAAAATRRLFTPRWG